MNVEYLDTDTDAGQFIRLYPATPEKTQLLIAAIKGLKQPSLIWLHNLPGFRSVSNCELALGVQSRDIGVIINGSVPNFLWALSKQSLSDVVELLQPFTESSDSGNGFQWLYGPNASMSGKGKISVLISEMESGNW